MKENDSEKEVRVWYHNLDPNTQAHIKNEFNIIKDSPWDNEVWIEFLIEKKKEADNVEAWA